MAPPISGIYRVKFDISSEWLGFSVSWEPLSGSPELHQLEPEILGSGEPPNGSHDAQKRSYSGILALKFQLKSS